MLTILTVVHLIAAIGIIALVLLQQGRGADMGAAFGGGGGGSSGSLFGARGSANFLSRSTAGLAVTFFVTGLSLAYIYTQQGNFESVTQSVEEVQVEAEGAVPDVPGSSGQSEAESDVPAVPESGAGESSN